MGNASPWVGLLAAILAGLFIAAIYAVTCIRFKADQVVSGAAINILMLGIPGFLSGAFFLSSGSTPQLPKEHLIPLTPIFIAFAMVFVSWYVMYRTPFGLRLRAVGEKPEAADAAGVSVNQIRYWGVLLAGALAGIGGAYLLDWPIISIYKKHDGGPRIYCARRVDLRKVASSATMLACLLFGFTEAVSIQMQGAVKLPSGEDIPVQFIQMVPYVLTIVVLAGFIGSSKPPGALGIPYQKEK
jgi:simple sugar transport system permease protein